MKILKNLPGRYRLAILATIVWLAVAVTLYLPETGRHLRDAIELPIWTRIWWHFFPLGNYIPLYDVSCDEILYSASNSGFCDINFSITGFTCLALYPIILLWLIGFGIAWVRRGFIKTR